MVQLHKRFTDSQVKELIERYLSKESERGSIQEILGIGKTRFFALINAYRHSPHEFSIQYERNTTTRTIPQVAEDNILRELQTEKDMIENPDIPLRHYNHSYIRDLLRETHHQKVSLSTIIDRAKKHGFYVKRKAKKPLMTGRCSPSMQESSSSMTPPTTSGLPLRGRSGT